MLFPGYLFIEVDPDKDYTPVKYTRGVFGFVTRKFSGEPIAVPEEIIEGIRQTEFMRGDSFGKGSKVYVKSGPFAHFEGTVRAKQGSFIDVVIELLHRPQVLSFNLRDVQAA